MCWAPIAQFTASGLQVQVSAASLIAADSAARAEELAALAGTWDGEKRIISKYVYFLQCQQKKPSVPRRISKVSHPGYSVCWNFFKSISDPNLFYNHLRVVFLLCQICGEFTSVGQRC